MDKRSIARNLRAISALYLIMRDGEEQAAHYRFAADTIRKLPAHVNLDIHQLRTQFYFSESVLQSVHLLLTKGRKAALSELSIGIPTTLLEVLELPGFGPKLTGRLYRTLGIRSLDELETALTKGALAFARVLPNEKLTQLPVAIHRLRERKATIPIPIGLRIATDLIESILHTYPHLVRIEMTGTLRRMCPISTRLELLCAWDGDVETLSKLSTDGYTRSPSIFTNLRNSEGALIEATFEKNVEQDELDIQFILYLVKPTSFAFAWTITTGDRAHEEWLWRQIETSTVPAGIIKTAITEEEVYKLAKLPYVIPELREKDTFTSNAQQLVQLHHIQGDLHMHSRYSDGADTMEMMVHRCVEKGYSFLALTDHSQSLDIAHGLTIDRLMKQRDEVLALREKYPQISIFHGTEVDILADATLDFPDVILESLDFVVASIHSSMTQSKEEITARLLYAIESPYIDMIGHPTGRMLRQRDSYAVDFDRIFSAAEHSHVALELNCNPNRFDLDPEWLRLAMKTRCLFAVDSDAHSVYDLERLTLYGPTIARKGLLTPDRIINTWDVSTLRNWLSSSAQR